MEESENDFRKKSWLESIGAVMTIIAALGTIFGVTVFEHISLISNNKTSSIASNQNNNQLEETNVKTTVALNSENNKTIIETIIESTSDKVNLTSEQQSDPLILVPTETLPSTAPIENAESTASLTEEEAENLCRTRYGIRDERIKADIHYQCIDTDYRDDMLYYIIKNTAFFDGSNKSSTLHYLAVAQDGSKIYYCYPPPSNQTYADTFSEVIILK